MRTQHTAAIGVAALLTAALTAGCGTTTETTKAETTKETAVTRDEAVARVDARAQEAFQHLPPGATLKQKNHLPGVVCGDGRLTFVETDYDILFKPGWPVEQSMQSLADYWSGNGYTIVQDDRDSAEFRQLIVEKNDRFRVGYQINHQTDDSITASLTSNSPCMPV